MTYQSEKADAIIGGLNLLKKYSDEININPAHDELFIGFDGLSEKVTPEDREKMKEWGWMDSEEDGDALSIFC